MPKILMIPSANFRVDEGPGDWLEQALSNLGAMTNRNWKTKRESIVALVRQVKDWYDGTVVREAASG